jgi:hypothetical protein
MGTRGEEFDDKGSRRGAARAAAVAARKTLPGDEHIRAHAQELITFSPRQKTDWGKKRTFFENLFQPRINWIDTDNAGPLSRWASMAVPIAWVLNWSALCMSGCTGRLYAKQTKKSLDCYCVCYEMDK